MFMPCLAEVRLRWFEDVFTKAFVLFVWYRFWHSGPRQSFCMVLQSLLFCPASYLCVRVCVRARARACVRACVCVWKCSCHVTLDWIMDILYNITHARTHPRTHARTHPRANLKTKCTGAETHWKLLARHFVSQWNRPILYPFLWLHYWLSVQ